MSLRRDFRRFLRAATKALKVYAKRPKTGMTAAGDGGKGVAALGKALGELQADPTLAALDTTPPQSYAGFGEIAPGGNAAPVPIQTAADPPEAPPA